MTTFHSIRHFPCNIPYVFISSVHLYQFSNPYKKQISKQEPPMMLFRNVVRGKEHRSLCTCKSTFITAVNSNRVLADLSKLIVSTTKVKGMLMIANIHAEPFVTICNNCSLPADTFGTVSANQLNCSTCKELTTYRRCLQLHFIIQTEANVQYKCILKDSLLLNFVHL